MNMKHFLMALCVTFVANQAAWAEQKPHELVMHISKSTSDFIKTNKDEGKFLSYVEGQIAPKFDFQQMSKMVLGKAWRSASDSQKENFTQAFKNMLVVVYGKSIKQAYQSKINVKETVYKNNEAIVEAELIDNALPIKIVYYFHDENKTGDWKVYNVSIEGLNLVSNYRQTFSQQIKQGGLDGLINSLNTKFPAKKINS